MRLALLACAALVVGCSGGGSTSHPVAPAIAPGFPATRWVPAHPTYVLAAPTLREAQRAARDVFDALGVVIGADAKAIGELLSTVIAIDPLRAEALSAIGIDLEGGFVLYSEDVEPTFVVHLSSPEAVQGFFDGLRERGLVTQSVVVEGIELFTAQLPGSAHVKASWAIAADWLWVHFSTPLAHAEGTTWFTGGARAEAAGWAPAWRWAQPAMAAPALVGFVEAREVIGSLAGKAREAVACARLVEPLHRIGISIAGGPTRAAGTLTLDLGPAAASLARASLPVPAGFPALAAGAPIAVQWNLDVLAVLAWLQPCTKAIGADPGPLQRFGVRSLRAVLRTFEPDGKSGTGAVSLDLAHDRYLAALLDEVPMRSTLERSRTFGPHAGHTLSVPFVATLDYVLTDHLALAGIGDGLLARLVGDGAVLPGPLVAIDVVPPALTREAWRALVKNLGLYSSDAVVDQLLRWRDGHIAVTIEGTSLVVRAAGNRR